VRDSRLRPIFKVNNCQSNGADSESVTHRAGALIRAPVCDRHQHRLQTRRCVGLRYRTNYPRNSAHFTTSRRETRRLVPSKLNKPLTELLGLLRKLRAPDVAQFLLSNSQTVINAERPKVGPANLGPSFATVDVRTSSGRKQ